MDQQIVGAAIVGTANRCMESGRIDDALEIFWGLRGTDFEFDSNTLYNEAICRSRIGQYELAAEGFEQLLRDEGSKGTKFRADIVRELAHVRIKLDQPEGLEELLDEAYGIYEQQQLVADKGTIRHLQGLVLMHKGRFEEGLKLIAEGNFSGMRAPDYVPSWLGTNQETVDPVAGLARTALAVTS